MSNFTLIIIAGVFLSFSNASILNLNHSLSFCDENDVFRLTSEDDYFLKLNYKSFLTKYEENTILTLCNENFEINGNLAINSNFEIENLKIKDSKQWRMFSFDNFENGNDGWSLNQTTICGYQSNHILGNQN